MSNGRTLFVVAVILAGFGALAVAGAPALEPGESTAAPDTPTDEPSETGAEPTDGGEGSDGPEEPAERPAVVQECAAEPPDDFAEPVGGTNETVGWVEGYWYNEPLDIDAADGLTQEELDSLSARTAARFEAMRCLTADGVPPVEIQSREEFQEEQAELFDQQPHEFRLFDNAKTATMLLSGTETDVTDDREANQGVAVGGQYNFIENEILIVSDDPETLLLDEQILAHELGHAIQDQQYDLAQYERPTIDQDKGKLGLIEGDVHLIEERYLEACRSDEWTEPCITDESDGQAGGGQIENLGLLLKTFQPYNDGPAFVEHIYEEGDGWESVNELYENPPTSAIHTVQPELYPEFERSEPEIPDQSTGDWERFGDDPGQGYDTVGVAGIAAMFMSTIYPEHQLFDENPDVLYQYQHEETEGWQGDRLYPYRSGNQTGAVWGLEWETTDDAETFVEAYEQMIDVRGGEAVEGTERTYAFEPETDYDMAVTIEVDGDDVTIVTAPSIEELDEIHDVDVDT